jgi:hypothetical protein
MALMSLYLTTNLHGVRAIMERRANELARTATNIPIQAAQAGRSFAMSIAPRDSGALWRAIDVGSLGNGQAIIRVDPTRLAPNNYGRMFNYASYMHKTNGLMGRGVMIITGDPRFMVTTRNWLKTKIGTDTANAVRTILK